MSGDRDVKFGKLVDLGVQWYLRNDWSYDNNPGRGESHLAGADPLKLWGRNHISAWRAEL